MIDQIKEEAYQPKGIKAFGWGLLGFIGTNLIINTSGAIITTLAFELQSAVFVLIGLLIAMALGIWFARTRRYDATTVGCWVAIGIQTLGIVAALLS
jgi:hypothetical protein